MPVSPLPVRVGVKGCFLGVETFQHLRCLESSFGDRRHEIRIPPQAQAFAVGQESAGNDQSVEICNRFDGGMGAKRERGSFGILFIPFNSHYL